MAALWPVGSRDHEPRRLAFQQEALWRGARGGPVESGALQLLCGTASETASAASPEARPEGVFRRRADDCDSTASRGSRIQRRGLSQDLGPASSQGHPKLERSGSAPAAGKSIALAGPAAGRDAE